MKFRYPLYKGVEMKFCDNCNNITTMVTTSTDMYFKCKSCNINYPVNDNDTLIFKSDEKQIINNDLTRFLPHNPIAPKIKKKCPYCDGDYARYIRIGDEQTIIFGCISCEKTYSNANVTDNTTVDT